VCVKQQVLRFPRRDSVKLRPILDCSSWEDSPEQSTTLTPLLFWLPPLEAAAAESVPLCSVSVARLESVFKLAPASRAERPTRSPAHRPCASGVGRCESSDMPISPVQGIGVRCIPQLVAPIDARVGGLHPRDERSRHLDSAGVGLVAKPPAWPTDLWLRNLHRACGFTLNAVGKASHRFEGFEKLRPKKGQKKGSMVGFISNLAPLLNYLRRRSPGPPFPPDHRQAGERGATKLVRVAKSRVHG